MAPRQRRSRGGGAPGGEEVGWGEGAGREGRLYGGAGDGAGHPVWEAGEP